MCTLTRLSIWCIRGFVTETTLMILNENVIYMGKLNEIR